MAAQLEIAERRVGDVAVLALAGRLVADEEDILFTRRVEALAAEGVTRIVVDFHDVTILDSGGIGVLVAKLLTLRRHGGDLRLARLTERTRRVLTMTHLLEVFAVFASEEEATRSFGAVTKA